VENITDIPDSNSEYWQFLQYEVGQFYAAHHDYIPFHLERAQGVRILTVFLYLSDVEEGGGTHFNSQNITIQPKMGRAVIWPSVLDKDPNRKDFRTGHEALPVIKGVKYAANGTFYFTVLSRPILNEEPGILRSYSHPIRCRCLTAGCLPLLSTSSTYSAWIHQVRA
jgi:prolyl 4-hydroxylase